MQNYKSKFKILTFYIVILIFTFLIFNFTDAQASQEFLVSWQAESYVPSWYNGKILPTKGSLVEVNFELIDKAKIANLSKEKVRWYINDKLMVNEENGLGLKSLRFAMPDYPGRETEIRIQIFHYQEGSDVLDKIIRIPSVSSEAVIDAPFPDRKINVGSSSFKTSPFFFNVKNLSDFKVEWSAFGQRIEEPSPDQWSLNLNIDSRTPKGTEISLSVSIKNLLKELEFVSKSVKLLVQ